MNTNRTSDNKQAVVVVIDDDEAARASIGQMLRLRDYEVELFLSAEAALAWPGLWDADCVVTDVKMPGMDGEEFLAETQRRKLVSPIVMITGHGDVSMAVRCLKSGAYNFVEKPFEDDVLLACIARAVEKTAMRRESEELRKRLNMLAPEEAGRFGMIGRSRDMQDVYQQIEVAAGSDIPVLIMGETGAGKELVARAIHAQSARSEKQFIPVNAGALPENMLESELFGHARGAFTGADHDRDGKLVTASGGTLLLDEIESISEQAQIKLLRVLDDGLVVPLGKDQPRKVDIRFLATTKVNLSEHVSQGHMREDFYHRIVVFSIDVPPLRQHPGDIPLLISHFMKAAAHRSGMYIPKMSEQTLAEMVQYTWPGNVRELRNAVERLAITAQDGVVGAFARDERFAGARLLSLPVTLGRLRDEMERTERTVIESVLREQHGEINAACRALGISRRALYERMKKYGLQKEKYRS